MSEIDVFIPDFLSIANEIEMLKAEVVDMDDVDLVDECGSLEVYDMIVDEFDRIYEEFMLFNRLSYINRKKLEASYILAYGRFCIGV